MAQNDYELALLLQKQFEHEASIDNPPKNLYYSKKKTSSDKCLVDPSWELIDPTPNIHNLFVAFNEKYFWNQLLPVCVEWSKRMTSCAGVCTFNGRSGLCSISLSEPLLKLRPRKDLVETLLHEMIHAYLFLTANNKDREGHGPEFHKHMYRINNDAGTNITVYHNFLDEVRLYQQHWWRCNGPCQYRKPYFGMVRKARNAAPGPNDRWWDQHLSRCGGSFIKVKEPEKRTTKKGKVEPAINTINKYFPVLNEKTNNFNDHKTANNNIVGINNIKEKTSTGMRINSNGTVVITKNSVQITTAPKPVATKKPATITTSNDRPRNIDYECVRNYWINKYPAGSTELNKREKPIDIPERNTPIKRLRPDEPKLLSCPSTLVNKIEEPLVVHDRNIPIKRPKLNEPKLLCPVCHKLFNPDEINSHLDSCLEEPSCTHNPTSISHDHQENEMISCLICSKLVLKRDLNIHLDECMGDDIFTTVDTNRGKSVEMLEEEMDNKYDCPVCSQKFLVSEMSDHLNACLITDNTFDDPF